MALHRINEFDPNYPNHFNNRDILKFDVYSGGEKVGAIDDVLIDQGGHIRYLAVQIGTWIFGKKVLIPIGRSQIDEQSRRVYIEELTREQVNSLPEYQGEAVDYDYEERVRGVYRPKVESQGTTAVSATHDRTSYHYNQDPELYTLNERDHGYWKRAEARLMAGRPIAGKHRRAIGIFPSRRSTEEALLDLRDEGFPMDRISVVARDADKQSNIAGASVQEHLGNKAEESAAIGAVSGGALGGITGLLVGLGAIAIPGVGPILLAGATATALATTLAGGAIGALSGGLLGALIGLGIPEERARIYQDRIARGDYLVIVDGTDADIARAETLLRRRGIEEYGIYDAPARPSTHPHDGADVPIAPTDARSSTHLHDVADVSKTVPTAHPITTTQPPRSAEASNISPDRQFAIGFFSHLSDAESAIDDLRRASFPLNQISLVAHNLQRRDRFSGLDLRDRFEAARLGIPAEQAHFYEDRLGRGEYLVIVHGTEGELNHATPMLNRRGIQAWRVYQPTIVHYELPVEAPRIPKATVVNAPATLVTPDLTGSRIDRAKERLPYAVGFFSHRRDAEQGIADLRNAGFPLRQVSLVAQRFDQREPFTGVDLHDRFDNSRFGIPEERIQVFHDRITRGDYLVLIRGTTDQLRQAEAVLSRPRIHEFGIYDANHGEITHHSHESVQRYVAPDMDPTHPNRDPRVDPSYPQGTIVDRRNETYR